jgi:hypothetical protein
MRGLIPSCEFVLRSVVGKNDWSTGWGSNPRILVLQTSALATSPPVLMILTANLMMRGENVLRGSYCGCAVVRKYGFTVL